MSAFLILLPVLIDTLWQRREALRAKPTAVTRKGEDAAYSDM